MTLSKLYEAIIRYEKKAVYKYQKRRIKNDDFTIISNDCWAAEFYKQYHLPYKTPFVGLMLMAPCYIQLLKNLPKYLNSPLHFKRDSKYDSINNKRAEPNGYFPIGVLAGDVEIQFLHYVSEQEAEDKWKRRMQRVNWKNIFVKFDCSKDLCTDDILKEFDSLKFPKVCFGASKKEKIRSLVIFPDWVSDGKLMYKRSLKYFDTIDWVNGGNGKFNPVTKALNLLVHNWTRDPYTG